MIEWRGTTEAFSTSSSSSSTSSSSFRPTQRIVWSHEKFLLRSAFKFDTMEGKLSRPRWTRILTAVFLSSVSTKSTTDAQLHFHHRLPTSQRRLFVFANAILVTIVFYFIPASFNLTNEKVILSWGSAKSALTINMCNKICVTKQKAAASRKLNVH